MKKLRNYFLRGLLVLVPAVLTIFAVLWAVMSLDGLFRRIFRIDIPGVGLIITVVLIIALGYLASHFIGHRLFDFVDRLFSKIPLAKLLYFASKDFLQALTGDRKGFDKPVLVELLPDGPSAIGFVTKDNLASLGLAGSVAVYMPQSYNFAGQMLILPAQRIKPLPISSAEAMKFIVSGGVSST